MSRFAVGVAEVPAESPWMTVKEITDWLRFPSEDACRTFLRRHGLASIRRGRVILVSRRDLECKLREVR